MRLWTVQSKEWFDKLKIEGEIKCIRSEISDQSYISMYEWMATQMKKRLGNNCNVELPIWAWAILGGKNTRPDLGAVEFKHYEYPSVFLEIEIPDNELLFSDEEEWCSVMSDMLNGKSDDDWERIFKLEDADGTKSRYVQACFEKLSYNQVINAKVFGKKKVVTNEC